MIITNIIVLVNMGNIYDDIGLPEKAIQSMEKVLLLTDSIKNATVIKSAAFIGLSNNYGEINSQEKSLAYAYTIYN